MIPDRIGTLAKQIFSPTPSIPSALADLKISLEIKLPK
jgi:hypothetical protein